jgi:ABC-type oligopeptide transport system substrate-binding subunit/DNA-binding SARP family transcriptional activator/tetratricopeptide (TPR) repeat protein
MLQARLLGQYEIRMDGQPVIISSRPMQSLLAYLVLHPHTSHRREKLAGQIWPDASESNARSNLRHALWLIRKAIGPGANVRIDSDDLGVTYHPQPGDQLDVDCFEVCSEEEGSTDALIQAVSAYGGDLLPGFYEEWVILEREWLQAAFERKMGRLLDCLLAERRWNEVLTWGERWIASGGTPEPAYRALMLAHAGLGNLSGAVAQYQRCVEALAREVGVQPSEKTREVFELIRNGGVESILPKPTQPTPATSRLPAFLEGPEKPAPVFVGREVELAALGGYLGKALQGQMQVAFVSGEAGSGKSALLQEFMRRSVVSHPDLAIGWGACNAFFGQGVPYLPFRDVLNVLAGGIESLYTNGTISRNQAKHLSASFPLVADTLAEQGPDLVNSFISSSTLKARAANILPGEQAWIKRIDKLSARKPASAGKQEKPQLFEQYAEVLGCIAGQHPLLILLDDLQWMDPGTGHLLFHLVRRLRNTCILIAGAYRVEEVALGRNGDRHPLEPLLNEFQSSFGEILIDLGRGRETSGREFIDAFLDIEPNRLDETFRQELYRRTQGHPLFTIQLLRNLQEREEIFPDEQGRWMAASHLNWESFSPQVEGIIGERIGRLDQELQDLLLAASVEGEQFTVQVLARVQGTAERVILQQLSRELEKRHRLVQELGETSVGGRRLVRFRFVHSLIQQYLYRRLGAAERAAFHQEIAETLEKLYQEDIASVAAPLARHYRKAGIIEKAVEYLLQAGDQARSLYAHQEAIDHYRQALAYLKEMDATEQTARTLMKLYLVYHSSFDFQRAQQALEEYNALWQRLAERNLMQNLPPAQSPYRLPTLKVPTFDPGLCETIFELEMVKELFCGLAGWSEDQTVIPLAAKHWEALDGGRRYVFHLRQDLLWSDGEPVTAGDFEFAWKRVLDPATRSSTANLLYDILGAKDFNQGRVADAGAVGVTASDPHTLVVELEEPCSYFPYILGDPSAFAVPKHVVERYGKAWTEPGRIVTSGAFQLESWDQPPGKTIHFTRNPRYFGKYRGNIERVTLAFYQNELDMYQAFVAGELDSAEFLLPQLQQKEWKHFQEVGQLHISSLPFVDAIYFMTDCPPFDNPDLRRALALATDRERLAREVENKLPATGGYIPPSLPGHSAHAGLPYDPEQAQRILAAAGYPQGRGFPPVRLLIEIVGLEKGDNLVFAFLQDMWKENLGVTIQKCRQDPAARQFEVGQEFHFFFIGWFADYPDPASFLQTNYLVDQSHWQNPVFDALIEEGRRTFDQVQRVDLYRRADRILTEEAVVLPLFYGHIYELRQPWVHKPPGSSIHSLQWKDITLMPH